MEAGRRGPSLPPGLLRADMPRARLRAPAPTPHPAVGEHLAVDHQHRRKPTAVSGHTHLGCVSTWTCCLRTEYFWHNIYICHNCMSVTILIWIFHIILPICSHIGVHGLLHVVCSPKLAHALIFVAALRVVPGLPLLLKQPVVVSPNIC